MKVLFLLLMLSTALQVQAEVYVCTSDKGTIYQDKPCASGQTRKLDITPAPTLEEQNAAQQRLQKISEQSQKFEMAAERARQQQAKEAAEQEKLALERRKLELLEQQAVAEQNTKQWVWGYPWYKRPYFPHHREDGHINEHSHNRQDSHNPQSFHRQQDRGATFNITWR